MPSLKINVNAFQKENKLKKYLNKKVYFKNLRRTGIKLA